MKHGTVVIGTLECRWITMVKLAFAGKGKIGGGHSRLQIGDSAAEYLCLKEEHIVSDIDKSTHAHSSAIPTISQPLVICPGQLPNLLARIRPSPSTPLESPVSSAVTRPSQLWVSSTYTQGGDISACTTHQEATKSHESMDSLRDRGSGMDCSRVQTLSQKSYSSWTGKRVRDTKHSTMDHMSSRRGISVISS